MKKLSSFFRNASLAAVGTVVAVPAFAIDTAGVTAAITSAETDALTVGQAVIATVAALVVVGIVIGIVRKV